MTAGPVSVWLRPIETYPSFIHLAPPVLHPSSSLVDVVATLAADPRSRAVFVIDDEDRLLGWIPERTLDADLLLIVLPGDVIRALGELDLRDVMRAARGRQQTARDLMTEAPMVTPETPLREALIAIARKGEHVVALVDDQRRLLGYVTLLDILAELLRRAS